MARICVVQDFKALYCEVAIMFIKCVKVQFYQNPALRIFIVVWSWFIFFILYHLNLKTICNKSNYNAQ